MKFRVTMKDPDGVYESLRAAARTSVKDVVIGLSPAAAKTVITAQLEELEERAGSWIRGGEYLTVEIDTETNTCVVVPRDA